MKQDSEPLIAASILVAIPGAEVKVCVRWKDSAWQVFANGGILADGRDCATFREFPSALRFAQEEAGRALEGDGREVPWKPETYRARFEAALRAKHERNVSALRFRLALGRRV